MQNFDLVLEPVTLKVVKEDADRVLWDIVLVGVGGTGGYILQSLMRVLKNFGCKGMLTLVDGDEIEAKNLTRQNFIEPDVGKRKVDVLASRYGNVYDMDIRCVSIYAESLEAMERLFSLRYDYDHYSPKRVERILIGAVDNNKSRQLFHEFFNASKNLTYIDAGNDGVLPVSGDVTEEDCNESGYSGQVVCGLRCDGKTVLPPVGEVYPDILEQGVNDFFPSQACGRTVVSYPQRMQTNLLAANVVLGFLNTLLAEGVLTSHYVNFNARNNIMRPSYITKDMISVNVGTV